jgi:hypothetical protein
LRLTHIFARRVVFLTVHLITAGRLQLLGTVVVHIAKPGVGDVIVFCAASD